ncbi:hypothetical protein BT96DRAFT_1020127 [Gymnopus androsaceus JB14]|uniref:GDP-fucose protein O-fucosyltransferase n=1 Tax=Gymnopus androsaceus JB14 TaxID=1447944 RepID=A0A6A4HLL4_9AGAR|nr:hypothetical protein BT96DRAFT_1020127 [Gymnopus androsaceus JB14]
MDTESLLSKLGSNSKDPMHSLSAKEAQRQPSKRGHRILIACMSLAALSFLGMTVFLFWTPYSWRLVIHEDLTPVAQENYETLPPLYEHEEETVETIDPWDPRASLNGPPTERFRDNLRADIKYLTSWPAAGWTNDVMTYANMIYLGFITDHVPVVPAFTPSHINEGAKAPVPPILFGDVFDVPRMRNLTGKSILEWKDVKDPQSEAVDEVGCWNIWEAVQYREHFPRRSPVPDILKLDISYTTAPSWVKLYPDFEHDPHATFWSLARLAFPEARNENLITPLPSPQHGVSLPPDEQLLCYDYLYYACAQQPYEYDMDYSPAWSQVAQYMHWTPSLTNLANAYINRAIGLPEDVPTPPYIAIHVRHYDFAGWCGEIPLDECFASITIIARRVREVQERIRVEKGITVDHVIMTSDERNQTWWQEVAEQGWKIPDHSQTKELYGDWHPVLVDATIQSGGIGFVGTDRSTMSIMAKRRVQSWQNGITALVKWGYVGADDH